MRRKPRISMRDLKIFILFLDIDGVLNSWASAVQGRRSYNRIEKRLKNTRKRDRKLDDRDHAILHTGTREVSNLNYLLQEIPNLYIVVSSTWRKGRTVAELRQTLVWAGLKYPERVIDKTPVIYLASGEPQPRKGEEPYQPIHQVRRGLEIACWLDVAHTNKQWNVVDYVIVDDDADMVFLKPKLVQTGEHDGLTMECVSDIFKRFDIHGRVDHMETLDKRL